jgi:hypothetical protein
MEERRDHCSKAPVVAEAPVVTEAPVASAATLEPDAEPKARMQLAALDP